ncbi:MAG: DNA polymerase III subunit gamma/tau [Rubrivivax sp.]|nr:DNA polymerase III subunit gamma/tau [Rubrivivax sp.]
MSTVVLARKYRPKRFDQMVGQEHVVRALTHALQQNRLHHAYLFTGTRGIGKTTVSRILAKSLNCTGADGKGGVTATPCGVCSACTEIDADRYIDYLELDAASNRSIDEIRDLIERAAYKPGVGRFKVFMIDEAHQLTKDAFNALLKTLEEPPDYLKFVLATTDPEKMLPTVLSRCLQFNLRPMAPDTVRGHLATVLQAEGIPFDEGSLRLLGRAARGSMRDALSLADQAIAYGGGRLEDGVVRTMLGSVDRGHAAALVQALAMRQGRVLLQGIDALRGQGLSAEATLDEMAALLQQMAVAQVVPDALDPGDPEQEDARRLCGLLPADETQLLYSMLMQGREELTLMGDEYAALTMVLVRFLAFAPGTRRREDATPPGSGAAPAPALGPTRPAAAAVPPPRAAEPDIPPWLDEVPPAEGEAPPRAAALRAPAPPALAVPAAAAPTAPVCTPIGERWAERVRALVEHGRIAALTRELALQAGAVACEEGDAGVVCWTLQVERESLRTQVLADKLAAALSEESGTPQKLQLQAGVPTDSVARRDAWARQQRQAEAEQCVRDDPALRELMAQCKTARIVPGSIRPL